MSVLCFAYKEIGVIIRRGVNKLRVLLLLLFQPLLYFLYNYTVFTHLHMNSFFIIY